MVAEGAELNFMDRLPLLPLPVYRSRLFLPFEFLAVPAKVVILRQTKQYAFWRYRIQ